MFSFVSSIKCFWQYIDGTSMWNQTKFHACDTIIVSHSIKLYLMGEFHGRGVFNCTIPAFDRALWKHRCRSLFWGTVEGCFVHNSTTINCNFSILYGDKNTFKGFLVAVVSVLDRLLNLFNLQNWYTLRLHLGELLDKRTTIETQFCRFY